MAWWLLLAGLAVMYLPVYWNAAFGPGAVWQTDENGHGPIILAVILWLFWSKRQVLARMDAKEPTSPVLGWLLFSVGVLIYMFGRSMGISSLAFASHLFVIAGALLLFKGASALCAVWFAVAYLLFLIPLPGTLVDITTGVLKQWISSIVETLLHTAGYPIARSGVMMTIGPYELLVADACSGLHSMFSLSALGTLYMYSMGRTRLLHNVVMLAAILPVAFVANIVRVVLLVLITFHLGDEAGQGFLHGAAGVVLMLVALVIFFGLDALLAVVLKSGQTVPLASNAAVAGER
ncbi:exosortase B [Sphaerotilaceae bacterium SBD11-9]